jgi:hypothetical protein
MCRAKRSRECRGGTIEGEKVRLQILIVFAHADGWGAERTHETYCRGDFKNGGDVMACQYILMCRPGLDNTPISRGFKRKFSALLKIAVISLDTRLNLKPTCAIKIEQ